MKTVIEGEMTISAAELEFRFIRASGPGGQNVNKVATAVQLRFDVAASRSLAPEVKARLMRIAGRYMTAAGELIIEAKRFRSQERNRQDALERLERLIEKASIAPKSRKKTKPSRAAKEKRLDEKRRRSRSKQGRHKQTTVSD